MRTDYGLYGVALICFVIAMAFAGSVVPGYTPAQALGISVITIFVVLGIISAVVGYSVRPRMSVPTTQPPRAQAETRPEPEPRALETEESPPPPSLPPSTASSPPAPIEEVVPEPEPPEPVPEPTPVVTVAAAPTAYTESETLETLEPAKVEETPKAKPVRRRRKKT